MAPRTWLLFCATETVLCLTPGPAVLLVVSQAISRGARSGLAAALGILTANTGYFALSATGVGALLLGSSRAFTVVKWLGAAYLVWLGARMLFARSATLASTPVAAASRASFSAAVVTQGANPKALIFFVAILPQFIDPSAAVLPQILILGVTSLVIEFIVLGAYIATCHAARGVSDRPEFAMTLQRAGGVLLVVVGAIVVASCGSQEHAASTAAAASAEARGPAPPSCSIQERAFRSGLDPPAVVERAEPNLSGLPPLAAPDIAIVEVRISETGKVTEACMRRGVRTDVDSRVLDAVRRWQFATPRLTQAVGAGAQRFEAGTAVPIIMTVTVKVTPTGLAASSQP